MLAAVAKMFLSFFCVWLKDRTLKKREREALVCAVASSPGGSGFDAQACGLSMWCLHVLLSACLGFLASSHSPKMYTLDGLAAIKL